MKNNFQYLLTQNHYNILIISFIHVIMKIEPGEENNNIPHNHPNYTQLT